MAIAVCLLGLIADGCSNSENEIPVLHTMADYTNTMAQVQKLTAAPFLKADDAPMSKSEQHDLRVASLKVQGLIGFLPDVYSNYFIAGKIAFLLQDYPNAQSNLLACVSIKWGQDENPTYYIQTTSEAHYLLSKCFFLQNMYQQAADEAYVAVRHEPKSVLYRLAEAEAEAQMRHDKTARGILTDVLHMDPTNTRAQLLYKMIVEDPTPQPKGPKVIGITSK